MGVLGFWELVVRSRRGEDHRSRGTGAATYLRWDFLVFGHSGLPFMNRRAQIQLVIAIAMLLGSGVIMYGFWRGENRGQQAFFYDLSKRELFTADANLIPPIRGIDNAEEDGVKAVVIADKPDDKKTRRVAYLERYAPELKRDMEEARAKNAAPLISRAGAQTMRFVQRPGESQWHPLISQEAQRIVSDWTRPGPDGLSPVVCTP
jgi:hypothetical protein